MKYLYRLLPTERRAWRPAERLRPSAWAERHRVLTRTQSARSGPWRNDQAPYLGGIMDLCTRRDIEEITIVKAAQLGVSEALRCVIGYYAHLEPDPILIVLPDEQTGRGIVGKRLIPLMRDTPCLQELFTPASRDIQLRHLTLSNGFTLRLGWSGSPSTLAADPCRIVINDEVDKFQPWSGKESDPISLGYARTQTYEGRRKVINVSTPTTADGLIWRRYEASTVKLFYFVPCPHCGEYQRLVFSNLKWEPFDDIADPHRKAAAIERSKAAWYECAHCQQKITEEQKPAMIRAGRWLSEGQTLDKHGVLHGEAPQGSRVGLHIWAGYCLWIPWFRIAAEFIRTKDDAITFMGFTNAWLGEPFRERIVHAKVHDFEAKCQPDVAAPARIVPSWARVLLATVDTQRDHFYFVVRAWGYGYRSQRVDHGLARTFDELKRRLLDARYPWASGKGALHVAALGIDSGGGKTETGSRTQEVYRFALEHPERVHAFKGDSRPRSMPIRTRRITYRPPGQEAPFPVFLNLLDTNHFKDRLGYAINATVSECDLKTGNVIGEVEQWALNDQDDPDYNKQLTAEHKVLSRKPGGRAVPEWVPVSSGAANHYFDCEYMQFALADMVRVDTIPSHVQAQPQGLIIRSGMTRPDGRPFVSQRDSYFMIRSSNTL